MLMLMLIDILAGFSVEPVNITLNGGRSGPFAACAVFSTAVSQGLCCIALLGVWNWRGTDEHGGKAALPDWDSIALNDRPGYIVFDSVDRKF